MRLREFAPSPDRDHNDDVPDPIFVLANRWWNATDRQPQIEHVLNSLGWSIHQVESEDDAVQLQHRDGTTHFISADDFDPDLFEISDDLRRSYLDRAGKVVDRRLERMARVRDRLNKGYEIYHADRPAGSAQIVDRFEADTPALAQQYYEKFIRDYVSDVDFDLRLRRSTGIMEGLSQNQAQVRKTLNAWMNQDQQYEDPTQRAGFQAKVWPYIQKNIQLIMSDKGADGKGSYPAAPYAAWLLVQHMDAYPQNQASFLSALEQSGLDPTDGDGKNIGKLQFLRDRLAVNKWIAANANNKEYYVNGKPLPNPTVNVRNPAMFKDAGQVATSRDGALKNAIAAGNKLLVAAVQATNAQTQPSFKQGVNEAVNPMRQQAGRMIDKYFGKIYEYGDSGLDYLDNHAPTWYGLSDQYNGDIDVIIATAPANLLAKAAQELKKVAGDLGYELSEAAGTPQYVTRIDSGEVKDFDSNMPTYYHTKDWSQSGQFKPGSKIPKNFSGKVQGTFAGDPHRTALYATGNANETRYVEFTQNGQPIVYFDKKDLPKMRGRKTYLTVFDAANFKKLPTGEYFSDNPGKPVKQEPIADPFQYIASQGWIVRTTDDLNKVFKQVQALHKAGKIPQYGGEGMDSQSNLKEIARIPQGDFGDKDTLVAPKHDVEKKELPGGSGFTYAVDKTGTGNLEIMIFDGDTLAAELDLFETQDVTGAWRVETVAVNPEYRSRGLGKALYGIALSILRLTVEAGDTQTKHGRRMWLMLNSIPGVEVVGYNMERTGKYKPGPNDKIIAQDKNWTKYTFPVRPGVNSMCSARRGVGMYTSQASMIAQWTGK